MSQDIIDLNETLRYALRNSNVYSAFNQIHYVTRYVTRNDNDL